MENMLILLLLLQLFFTSFLLLEFILSLLVSSIYYYYNNNYIIIIMRKTNWKEAASLNFLRSMKEDMTLETVISALLIRRQFRLPDIGEWWRGRK